MRHVLLLCLSLLLAGCKPPEESPLKAIVGAVLIDGTGGPPISDSVVTIEGSRIRAVGTRTSLPVPPAADKIDGAGKFLVPGLIDLHARLDARAGRQSIERSLNQYLSSGVTSVRGEGRDLLAVRQAERQNALLTARLFVAGRASNPGDVAALAAQQVDAIETGGRSPAVLEAILDESRKYRLPVIADIFSLADARLLLDNGAAGFLHMIQDTEAIDPALIARLRDLRLVFTPVLAAQEGARREIAGRNTKRLAEGGVLIGAGSDGSTHRELELLAEAGLSPAEVLTAATRNGALALGQLDQLGTVEPGKRADLLLLSANPAEDARNLRKIDRIMLDGQWIDRER